jgi:hypothetical protein
LAEKQTEESRIRALAFNRLRAKGVDARSKELLGTIVEYRLEKGLEVLAIYSDHRLRYFNQAEKLLVWEAPNQEIDKRIDRVLSVSRTLLEKGGVSPSPRSPAPRYGSIRLTFLLPDGLYVKEGPRNSIQSDSLVGPVYEGAAFLLAELVQRALAQEKKQ